MEDHPVFPKNVCKNLLVCDIFWEVIVYDIFWEVIVYDIFWEVIVYDIFWEVIVYDIFWEVIVYDIFWEVIVYYNVKKFIKNARVKILKHWFKKKTYLARLLLMGQVYE